jgi:hypothetical protein
VEAAEIVPDLPEPSSLTRRRPWVRMQISTPWDLGTYSRDYEATLGQVVSLCSRGEVDLKRRLDSFTLAGFDKASAPPGELPDGPDGRGRYVYFLYLALDSRTGRLRSSSDSNLFIDHDLRRRNDDICFLFRGGSYRIIPHRSETFTIPYALIAAALARAGLPHAPTAPPADRP